MGPTALVTVLTLGGAPALAARWAPGRRARAPWAAAQQAMAEGRPAVALSALEEVLAEYPRCGAALLAAGQAHHAEGRPDAASPLLERALARFPDRLQVVSATAWVRLDRGALPAAEDLAARWAAAAPEDPGPRELRVWIAMARTDLEGAQRLADHLPGDNVARACLDSQVLSLAGEPMAAYRPYARCRAYPVGFVVAGTRRVLAEHGVDLEIADGIALEPEEADRFMLDAVHAASADGRLAEAAGELTILLERFPFDASLHRLHLRLTAATAGAAATDRARAALLARDWGRWTQGIPDPAGLLVSTTAEEQRAALGAMAAQHALYAAATGDWTTAHARLSDGQERFGPTLALTMAQRRLRE